MRKLHEMHDELEEQLDDVLEQWARICKVASKFTLARL